MLSVARTVACYYRPIQHCFHRSITPNAKMTGNIQPGSCLVSGQMKMPIIGLGTWQSTPEEINTALNAAIDSGYRHIDTAYVYENEKAIGESLRKIFESGKIKREDLFIVTKLPPTGNRREDVETFIKSSLQSLQLDYVDLYLVHYAVGLLKQGDEIFPKDSKGNFLIDYSTDILELWKGMEAQVEAGRAKNIGLSNFSLEQVNRILNNCRVRPCNLQVEMHVYMQQKELVSFCHKNDITVTAYAPLGSPGLKGYYDKKGYSKDKDYQQLYPMIDPVINEIAKNHKKNPSHVLLRYLMQYGVAIIPKSITPSRIKDNYNLFDFELTKEEFEKISALDRGEEGRMFGGPRNTGLFSVTSDHPEYPFPK